MHRHFQEYTYCIRRVILTYSRAKLLVKKAKGFELMLIDSSREGCSLRQKLKFYRCLLENGLSPPSWTCIIISILSVVMESNMPCNAYQFYLFLEVKLINFLPAFHKRASLVISFNFDPSEVWRRQRTWLLYLCCMLTCLPKVHPEFTWIWSLQEGDKTISLVTIYAFNLFTKILCAWVFCFHVCTYTMYMLGAHRGQMKVLDPL